MVKKEVQNIGSEGLLQRTAGQELEYQNVEIKFSTKAELSGKNYALNITYRNQKNEILWVSVRAMLGIEVARMVAKRDSVWIISKMGQIKEKGTWRDMSKMIGYPLDFIAFQNIMTRRLFYPGNSDKSMLKSFLKRDDGNKVLLVPNFENKNQRNDVATFGFLPQFIIDKKNGQLMGARLVPEDNEWMLEIMYQEDAGENMGLGKNLLLKALDSQSILDMNLKIQQVKINEALKFPFQWF